ncbi:MAG: sensor domain-containing diguanylate cyclase [Candidatus Thiodiazotropha sp. (ex Semelilucina semeliformis)]|nr:sensor domain-containing diguanylate cyclase [Candidatus Thiodiazotropha sp. (ex Myrtea spinifera)]MCU7807373.1 sensor domain-containing diguanylate cyclase [Candidatus Thiodiazotropha sp. (ex Semelilucina semeliformis)]
MKKELLVSFLLLFIPASLLISTIFYAFSNQSQRYELQTIQIREESALRSATELTSMLFEQKLSDLMVLAEGETLRKYLHDDSMLNWVHVAREFSLFARRKPKYAQIRYIGIDGHELVRVNNKAGEQEIVPKTLLQNKGDRYYVQEAIKLSQGDIYVSPLDLNMENGAIEKPIVPTIRFATPVHDGYGTLRGILIINYTPEELLDRIADIFKTLIGDTVMLNSDGYWLMGAPDEQLWGFMHDSEETFGKQHPDVWATLLHSESGSVSTQSGLFIYQRAFPLNRAKLGSVENIQMDAAADQPTAKDRYWFYVSHISKALIDDLSSKRALISSITYLLLFLVTAFISSIYAKNAVQKKLAFLRLQQHATTDELTNIANRRELQKTGENEFKRAHRFNRNYAILMIDLDHFKVINDTHGHSIGDEVLKHIANICLDITRTEDLLARYGGEEFVMLLPETDIEGARQLAERICQDVRNRPFESANGPISITVSIGVSEIGPVDTSYSDILLRADKALYQAKSEGRDRVVVMSVKIIEKS